MSPGLSLSRARVTSSNKPSEADSDCASILSKELEIINSLEEREISMQLRANPSLQAFQVQDLSIGRFVVVHIEQGVGPWTQPPFVVFDAYGEIAMAVFRRSPDCAHL